MAKPKKIKGAPQKPNNRMLIIAALAVVALASLGFALWEIKNLPPTDIASVALAPTAKLESDVQVINMKVSAAGYEPNLIVVRKGIPVKIITDSTSDAGCVRGFQMPDLGVPNKALEVGRDEIDFIPDKVGEFGFNCQMRMSTGKVNVVA